MPPKRLKNKKYYLLAAILLAILGGFFYFRSRGESLPPKSTTVEKRTIKDTIELSGEVTAESYANLHFMAGGLVTYAPFQEGDHVAKWSTIASLDTRSLKQTLEKQLNLYAKERHDFDQTQDDYEHEIATGDIDQELRRILEKAQYDLDNSVIDVELQDLAVRLSRLSSPINGILASSPIATANVYVGPTDVWYVVDPDSLTFTADLDESDLYRVEPGQAATIELDAYPDWVMDTTVERIAYQSKLTTTGTIFELTLHLPPEHRDELRLGLNGNVSILRKTYDSVLTIPIESVKETEEGTVVTIEKDGKPTEKLIKLGVSDDMYYEVVEGLSDGETIYYGK